MIEAAAERLATAAATGVPCAPVRDLIDAGDQDAAYRVQAVLSARRAAAGERIVGRKIGLTSRAVQAQLGVDSPDFGTLFGGMAYADREPMPLARFLQPRVEAEVAFVLGRDVDVPDPTVADVVRATDHVLAAVEVVDSRITGWDITIADTIADNASSGAFVLGTAPRRLADVDLVGAGMVLEQRGDVVSCGAGVACLGSPVAAVVWLARALGRQGQPLRAGDVVLSGALGPVVPVTAPGAFRARISGLGDVTAVFEDRSAR
ncbi:fumarylacetoacetate hydrolase family protein [Dactylosporangium sp. NPDC000244]|uniref:2-keto-4-pentenoate hydratase n=1 Tax=Dactylosporangium sp. NPDC000244 TaxID=3154365 RepID=UPI00332E2368